MKLNRRLGALVTVAVAALVSVFAVTVAMGSSPDTSAILAEQRAAIERGMPPTATYVRGLIQSFGDRTLEVGRNVTVVGNECVELRSSAGWRSASCQTPAAIRSYGPIIAYTGGTDTMSFLHGSVSPAIKALELVRADCSREQLPLSANGLFLDVTSTSAPSPWKLLGSNPQGKIIATKVLEGRGAGQPSNAC